MFDENLNKLEWIDEQSKIEARKKLKKITEKIGYPDFIYDTKKLNERFVKISKIEYWTKFFVYLIYDSYIGYSMISNEYFNNSIKVLERERRRSLLKFQQKVDLTE